jgi:hypothetical protein
MVNILHPSKEFRSKVLLKISHYFSKKITYKLDDIELEYTNSGLNLYLKIYDDSNIKICCEEWNVYNKEENEWLLLDLFTVKGLVILYNNKKIHLKIMFENFRLEPDSAETDFFEANAVFAYNNLIDNMENLINNIPNKYGIRKYLLIKQYV